MIWVPHGDRRVEMEERPEAERSLRARRRRAIRRRASVLDEALAACDDHAPIEVEEREAGAGGTRLGTPARLSTEFSEARRVVAPVTDVTVEGRHPAAGNRDDQAASGLISRVRRTSSATSSSTWLEDLRADCVRRQLSKSAGRSASVMMSPAMKRAWGTLASERRTPTSLGSTPSNSACGQRSAAMARKSPSPLPISRTRSASRHPPAASARRDGGTAGRRFPHRTCVSIPVTVPVVVFNGYGTIADHDRRLRLVATIAPSRKA